MPDSLDKSSMHYNSSVLPLDRHMTYRVLLCTALFCLLSPVAPAADNPSVPVPAALNDTRIVIDTSGSMKQTDPGNLRIPALKLLVNLLPDGGRAGIWLFDSQARLLLPASTIDRGWKEKALNASAAVNSKGAYTHIEAALRAAAGDWNEPATAGVHRNIILLTDGMVDISKKPGENAASRERIFSALLPKFQQAGVQVYTIALSDQADHELMRQLALSTGGWSEVAQDAEQLQRAFIQMFNKTTPHEGVPLLDNHFTIDASIREFTVLMLLRPKAKPTRLITPDKNAISQLGNPPKNVRWVHEASYDLITVSEPGAGEWALEADIEPANQVLVVTDLKLDVTPIENFATERKLPEITASLKENGETVTREDFLKLLTVHASLAGAGGAKDFPMAVDPDRLGQYRLHGDAALEPGDYTLKVVAEGKTFQRETTQTFKIIAEPVNIETAEDATGAITVTLTPNPEAVQTESLAIQATLTDSSQQTRMLAPERTGTAWALSLPAPGSKDLWVINFQVTGLTPDGKAVSAPLKPLRLAGKLPSRPAPSVDSPSTPASAQLPQDWAMTAAIASAINIFMFAVGYLGYRLIRKRSEAAVARLLSRLEN